jgi:hypothetical protein
MKTHFLLLIFFIGTNLCTSAQEPEKNVKISPEFTLSLNMSHVFGDEFGVGVGLYNAFFNSKRCNLIVGLEYNSIIRRFYFLSNDDAFPKSHHYMGIPAYFRVNMGKKVKFFIEAGTFLDFIVFEKVIQMQYDVGIDDKTMHYFYKPDFGISGGIGLRIPVKNYEILVKSDYKWGMRRFLTISDITGFNRYFRFTVGFKANFAPKEKK